jgi:hypothetical protein
VVVDPGCDLFIGHRADIAPLVRSVSGWQIEVPIVLAFDRNCDEAALEGEGGLKLRIERALRQLRKQGAVREVDRMNAIPTPGYPRD